MCAPRMHPDERDIDAPLVRRLIAGRFPQWAGLPVERLRSSGTENAMFRLGTELVVRLPRHPGAVDGVAHEQRWLPRLAPGLPFASPEPLGQGRAGHGFPWPWSVYRWLEGINPVAGAVENPGALASGLAAYLTALRALGTADAPACHRGVPLSTRDAATREAIAQPAGRTDAEAVTALWEEALAAPEYTGAPVWAHGDLSPGNVLTADGRLTAVIDFGSVGVGDPAVDLIVAWNLLPAEVRGDFREAVGAGEAEWARGRGWALSIALIQLPYYWDSNPDLAANARHVIGELVAERG